MIITRFAGSVAAMFLTTEAVVAVAGKQEENAADKQWYINVL